MLQLFAVALVSMSVPLPISSAAPAMAVLSLSGDAMVFCDRSYSKQLHGLILSSATCCKIHWLETGQIRRSRGRLYEHHKKLDA